MPEIITENDARYAFRIVKKICSEIGPGFLGSPQEHARADLIKKELESHLGIDNVATEQFTFAPGAFLSTDPICGLFILFAALLNICKVQMWDNPDILTIEPLLNVLKLTFEWVINGGE